MSGREDGSVAGSPRAAINPRVTASVRAPPFSTTTDSLRTRTQMNLSSVSAAANPFQVSRGTSTTTTRITDRDDPTTTYAKSLTASDRDLIFAATGQRVDENSQLMPALAYQIATDRRNGAFSGGQSVSIPYLQDLSATYSSGPGASASMVEQLQKAMDYLRGAGQTGVDVSA
jgi:hypothetical protein